MSEHKEYELSFAQQIRLVNGGSFFGTAAVPEKGIGRLQLLDGGTGMNFEQLFGDFLSYAGLEGIGSDALRDVLKNFYTPSELGSDDSKKLYDWIVDRIKERFEEMTPPGCYPPGILLGATWNKDVIFDVGSALGEEACAYGVNVLLGTPNVNLHRDIRNGRLFEGYSEEPYLVSQLAPSMVKGVQSQKVAANVKHFAANHQETNRMNVNEHIPLRALHELYYPGFKACVKAGVATVMSAYNKINGVPCTENSHLLNDILRDDWGFDGVVMSDWGAVYNSVNALNSGNDLAMPGPIGPQELTAALEDGTLSKQALKTSSQRVARLADEYSSKAHGSIDLQKTDMAAYNAACEGIVLLKNEKNTLPLCDKSKIALFGKYSDYLLTCGEGSAGIITTRNTSFVSSLSQSFAHICHNQMNSDDDTLIYVYSLAGREGNDRANIDIEDEIRAQIDDLLKKADLQKMKKILVLNVSGPVALKGLENDFDAIICTFLPGMQGAKALADCLCGKVNPSGKLPLSWPRRIEDMPTYLNFPGDGMQVYYGEGIFVGYRWYDARKIEPLYPFGFGLSYTDFEIVSMNADKTTFTDSVKVSVTVKNIGAISGKTVVQLYVRDVKSVLTKPVRELKAFEKIDLQPDESKTIEFILEKHAFESYDPNLEMWTLEEGEYEISAAFSSRDIRQTSLVYADVKSPYSYGANTSVKVCMEDEKLKAILREFIAEHSLAWSAILSSYEYTSQDTLRKVLNDQGCNDELQNQLYERLLQVKRQ